MEEGVALQKTADTCAVDVGYVVPLNCIEEQEEEVSVHVAEALSQCPRCGFMPEDAIKIEGALKMTKIEEDLAALRVALQDFGRDHGRAPADSGAAATGHERAGPEERRTAVRAGT